MTKADGVLKLHTNQSPVCFGSDHLRLTDDAEIIEDLKRIVERLKHVQQLSVRSDAVLEVCRLILKS